jgi:hypothetical protein
MRPLLFLLALVLVPSPSAAAQISAVYEVRWLGLRIATSRVEARVEGGEYRLQLVSDYAALLSSGRITGEATGRVEGERVLPRRYSLGATGDPERQSLVEFERGEARRITITPPLEPDWPQGRVPLRPEHQRGVVDPLSALVLAAIRAGEEGAACRTTLPVFTGVSRFDVTLSPMPAPRPRRGEAQAAAPAPLTCRITFTPISGHRPANQTVRVVQQAREMRVEFEPQATGGTRLPRRIEIPTRWGTVSIVRRG